MLFDYSCKPVYSKKEAKRLAQQNFSIYGKYAVRMAYNMYRGNPYGESWIFYHILRRKDWSYLHD